MMRTEIVFQLTRRELDALKALDESPPASGPFDYRTIRALVNKGLISDGSPATLTPAGFQFLSFTRSCSLFRTKEGRGEP